MSDRGGRGGRGGAFRGGGRGGRGDREGSFQGSFRGGRGGGRGGAPPNDSRSKVFSIEGKIPAPDEAVTKLEDEIIAKHKSEVKELTAKMGALAVRQKECSLETFPERPSFGSAGRPVVVWANYFPVDFKIPIVYKYVLHVTEETTSTAKGNPTTETKDVKGRKLHLAVQHVLKELATGNKNVALASQFKNQILSVKRLSIPSNPMRIVIPAENEGEDPNVVSVLIDAPTEVNISKMTSYAQSMDDKGDRNTYPKFPEVIDVLDIILGHNARSKLGEITAIGGSRFFPFNKHETTASLAQDYRSLIAARGFFQSARLATGRLLLNTNVTHGVFRVSGKLDQVMGNLNIRQVGPKDDHRLKRLVAAFAKFLPKTKVWVTFTTENGTKVRRSKTLHGIVTKLTLRTAEGVKRPAVEGAPEFPGPKQISFWLQEKEQYITVYDYYKQKYGMNLRDFPVLNLGTAKRPTFYPAEVLEIQPGQSVKAKLTGDETTAMLAFACRTPYENALSLSQDARDVLEYDNNTTLKKFGVSVGESLATVNARVLNVPAVAYIDATKKKVAVTPFNGSWNMKSVRIFKRGNPISRWTYMNVVGSEHDKMVGEGTMKEFATFMADNMGVNIAKAPIKPPKDYMIKTSAQGLGLSNFFKWATGQKIQYIMFILGQKDSGALYAQIKRFGDCDHGIHTSCHVAKHLFKEKNFSYYTNVGLKVNLKSGGVNHKLNNEFGLIKEGKTMLVGYDVTHPTNMNVVPGKEPPSLVGLVASVDQDLAQWPAVAWQQKAKQEMLGSPLTDAFKSRLRLWQAKNANRLPENIVIFRDGVSEGQFVQVLETELPMIREACRSMYSVKQPKLSIIVSVKRHQTRFYPTSPGEMSRSGNIKNGTVVDRGVTLAKCWDFYLTAHDALQGTARPAHYTVLLDEVFISKYGDRAADELEGMTHQLCYLFGRATKAVSICPPAYYADIVCERARAHLPEYDASDVESTSASTESSTGVARQVHPLLKDTMYYM